MGSRAKGSHGRAQGENPKTKRQMTGLTGGAFGNPAKRRRYWLKQQEIGDRNRAVEQANRGTA